MAEKKPEIEGVSIVFLGDFNPKIFQPAWFAAQDLIRNEEAEKVKIEVIHEAIVNFSLEWLDIQVLQNRFLAGTQQSPYYPVLRDLVISTFRILSHTPIRMMGINFHFHFPMESEEAWHALGHRVTPKEIWANILEKPGLRSLSMEGKRPDDFKGSITARIEPSKQIRHGVYISINDHYEIKDLESSLGCKEIINILESAWDSSATKSKEIAYSLLEKK